MPSPAEQTRRAASRTGLGSGSARADGGCPALPLQRGRCGRAGLGWAGRARGAARGGGAAGAASRGGRGAGRAGRGSGGGGRAQQGPPRPQHRGAVAGMEPWKQCGQWLISCKVLPPNHRVTWDTAQVFDLAQTLRDGVLLCQLLNNLRSHSINLKEINLRPQMSQVRPLPQLLSAARVRALGAACGISACFALRLVAARSGTRGLRSGMRPLPLCSPEPPRLQGGERESNPGQSSPGTFPAPCGRSSPGSARPVPAAGTGRSCSAGPAAPESSVRARGPQPEAARQESLGPVGGWPC